ncbi:MAG: glycosyl transferase family 1, partial [Deltaproteobacteria bacterium]|nr:glycosyl transferase family 1 [Deltaproteobacteria bacterium]
MSVLLSSYEGIVGSAVLRQLRQLGEKLAGARIVHVNSTREGGGVAEILEWMVPLMNDAGLKASWEIIHGNPRFFEIT